MPDRESVARGALLEIAPERDIGPLVREASGEDGIVTLTFATRNPAYPGWGWTVALAELDEGAPSVLEVGLLPGDGALLAPDWIPWADRLEEYRAAQAAEDDAAAETGDEDADDDADADPDDLDDHEDHDDVNDGIDFEPDVEPLDVEPLDVDEPAAGEPASDEPASALAEGDPDEQQASDDEAADADPQPRRRQARRQRGKRRTQSGGDDPQD